MTDPNTDTTTLTDDSRARFHEIRSQLLKLHKSILEAERINYEKIHGRIESPHAFLNLLMHDPWFGWFRPISEILVRIDELLDSKETVTEAQGQALIREIRSLLLPAEEGEEFAVKYRLVMQEDPDIILQHAEISKHLL